MSIAPKKIQWARSQTCNVPDPLSLTYLRILYGKNDRNWQSSTVWSSKHCSQENGSALSDHICNIYHLFFTLTNSHDWEENWSFGLFPSRIFLRIGTLLDGPIPGFPQKPVGLSLLVQLRLVVRDSLFGAFQRTFRKKKKERKTGNYISTVPLEQQQSFFCPAASAETSSQQTDPSMFRYHNVAHCTLFVYLNSGPRLPGGCHHLYSKTDRAWK